MPTYEITKEDVEYLRHGDKARIARLYKPKGVGPFPAVVDLHGGAWTSGELAGTQGLDETLAKNGFVVASLNFRHAADGYPTSLIDINHAVRWVKAHARGDAAERFEVGVGGAPGRRACGRGDGARGGDVMAGDQRVVGGWQCPEA